MAAILATALVHLKAGDHVVCSNAVFGATIQLFNNILGRFGIQTTYVSPTNVDDWRAALRPNTPLLFLGTPSNPPTQGSDIPPPAAIAKEARGLPAGANVFCPALPQRPLRPGAHPAVHSAPKD